MPTGHTCPKCQGETGFTGVKPSVFGNWWVETYTCFNGHVSEKPIVRNYRDKDYRFPPYSGGNYKTT